ncbi:glycosyltransferase family 4 protein [Athalassotoga saccharophila]|uniref:glycosyltransferase family 4 protein n=1 Tax=Athalassotoga saccharophila TaxID=1441386 RepID=UPI00137A43F9|nr:glycosyltransferase family 1 protein [Athalassotoga saccharophila]BBJ28323.1 GDP-mannose:cellobiosyl-diphosphopolyprenol alpha-mannosyltransferase [Athalassotoga saccharophila]
MKIGIDVRHLTGPFSGIPSYTLRNIKALESESAIEFIFFSDVKPSDIFNLKETNMKIYGSKLKHARHLWKYHRFICKVVKEEKIDLLWFTTTEMAHCKNRNFKIIVTVHDAIPIINPEFHDLIGKLRFYFHLKDVIKHSCGIIYISKWSKDVVHKLYDSKKINGLETVIPPIITEKLFIINDKNDKVKDLDHTLDSKDHFLFFLGALGRRKGTFLIKEVAKIQKNTNFVLAGRKTNDYDELLRDKADNLVILEGISDYERQFLLSKCDAFIFPSYAEGFGMPIVEAMLAGKVVICSDLPIFKEITEGNAIFFKTGDVEDFSKAITRFYSMSEEEKDKMIKKGFEISKKYSEEVVKNKLIEFFNQVLTETR